MLTGLSSLIVYVLHTCTTFYAKLYSYTQNVRAKFNMILIIITLAIARVTACTHDNMTTVVFSIMAIYIASFTV